MDEKRKRLIEIMLEHSFKLGEFTLASGRTSDYYVDCRTTTLHPEGALLVAEMFLEQIKPGQVEAVGGLTLGADPIVGSMILLSQTKGRPLNGFIVRKAKKGHTRMDVACRKEAGRGGWRPDRTQQCKEGISRFTPK